MSGRTSSHTGCDVTGSVTGSPRVTPGRPVQSVVINSPASDSIHSNRAPDAGSTSSVNVGSSPGGRPVSGAVHGPYATSTVVSRSARNSIESSYIAVEPATDRVNARNCCANTFSLSANTSPGSTNNWYAVPAP